MDEAVKEAAVVTLDGLLEVGGQQLALGLRVGAEKELVEGGGAGEVGGEVGTVLERLNVSAQLLENGSLAVHGQAAALGGRAAAAAEGGRGAAADDERLLVSALGAEHAAAVCRTAEAVHLALAVAGKLVVKGDLLAGGNVLDGEKADALLALNIPLFRLAVWVAAVVDEARHRALAGGINELFFLCVCEEGGK